MTLDLDGILLREVCHSRQNWQRDGQWHDWVEISPDEREQLVSAAKRTLTAEATLRDTQNYVKLVEAVRDEAERARDKADSIVAGLREAIRLEQVKMADIHETEAYHSLGRIGQKIAVAMPAVTTQEAHS